MEDFARITKSMFKLFMRHKKGFFIYLFLLICACVIGNIEPFFYKAFIDYVTVASKINFQFLLYLVIGVGVVHFLGGILFEMTLYAFDNGFFVKTLQEFQLMVFSHLQELDFNFHQNKKSGSLISAMSKGQNAFDSYVANIMFNMASFVINLIFLLVTFSIINIKIMLVFLVTTVAYIIAARFLITDNIERRNHFNEIDDSLKAVIADNLVNYDTVKFYRQGEFEISRLEDKGTKWKKTLLYYVMSYRKIGIAFTIITSISLVFGLFLAVQDTVDKVITVGTLVLIITFITKLYQQLSSIFYELREVIKNFSDLKAYFDILENRIDITDPKHPASIQGVEGNVAFNNVTFAYQGRKPVIMGVNMQVNQGQTAALVGRSGAGKTTISKLLLRLYDVTKGEITIDGINIRDFAQNDLKYLVGIVPQEPMLFNESVFYNIAYARPDATKKQVREAAKLAFLDEFIQTLPQKYDTEVGERGIKLSGGQKQRLAIARTIIQDPKVIIFDEATSHLDSESEMYIQQALVDISKNKTVIIIAHRLSTIMHADKIIVFENGRIVDEGTHSQLLENNSELYKRLWELQSKGEL
jgi:ABC-type multidrug transport system fused ATPase/permease subunit